MAEIPIPAQKDAQGQMRGRAINKVLNAPGEIVRTIKPALKEFAINALPPEAQRVARPLLKPHHERPEPPRHKEPQQRPKAREKHVERRHFVAPVSIASRREAQVQQRLTSVRNELKRQTA